MGFKAPPDHVTPMYVFTNNSLSINRMRDSIVSARFSGIVSDSSQPRSALRRGNALGPRFQLKFCEAHRLQYLLIRSTYHDSAAACSDDQNDSPCCDSFLGRHLCGLQATPQSQLGDRLSCESIYVAPVRSAANICALLGELA